MATDNTKTTTDNTEITTEENKSLLSKTKGTLIGLKDQAEEFFFRRNKDEKIEDLPQQQFENTKNLESAKMESDLSRFGSETISSASTMNKKYEQVDKKEFVKEPEILHQKSEFHDDKKDEIKYSKADKDEVHVLPTLHVEEKPVIVEKEIEYEKPVEIKQTIIHKEKPIIIEQPLIKEKHEHYREATDYQKKDTKIVKETVSEQDTGNQDTEALLNLRKERVDEYNNNSQPVVQKEKQFVRLDTDVREQPTQVHEKQVIYQQPVEIQKTHIEKVKPIIREEVTLEKEHIHEKLAPEIYQEDVKKASTQQYFSQDATGAATTATATDNLSTVTNDTTTKRDALSTNADADLRAGEGKRKEVL